MRLVQWMVTVFVAVLVAGCSSMKVEDFRTQTPKLVLEEYFSGQSKAWGVFFDRFGNLRRSFVVDIKGDWNPATQTLVLTEDFVYDDGEKDQRIWTIRKTSDGRYIGTAPDVIGEAQGQSAGNALNWAYYLDLKMEGGPLRVHFNDWMWQIDKEVLINKAEVSKFGIRIGDVFISFRRGL